MSFLYLGVLTAQHGGGASTDDCHFRISSYHSLLDESGGQVSRINIPEELSLMVEFVLCMMSSKLDLGRAPSSADYLTEELVIINRNVGTLSWDTQTDRNPGELSGSRSSQWKRCLVSDTLLLLYSTIRLYGMCTDPVHAVLARLPIGISHRFVKVPDSAKPATTFRVGARCCTQEVAQE
ncbi:hypothetical protein EDD85DRAFT_787203 [Armillaria nabsnona]|nr:hypothetical protein EDD85DRAFT_787203 [Armillaria nabsnona]